MMIESLEFPLVCDTQKGMAQFQITKFDAKTA